LTAKLHSHYVMESASFRSIGVGVGIGYYISDSATLIQDAKSR